MYVRGRGREKDKMAVLENEASVEEICASKNVKEPMVNQDWLCRGAGRFSATFIP